MWNVLGRGCALLEAVLAAVPKRIPPPNPAIAPAVKQVQFDDMAREGVEKGPSKKLWNRGKAYGNDDVRWDGFQGGGVGGHGPSQSTSAESALAPSCDLWPASVLKAQIPLTIASCSTWITIVFKHQQAHQHQLAIGDAAVTRQAGGDRLASGRHG